MKGKDAILAAEANFMADHEALLLSFDVKELHDAIQGWCRLEGIKRFTPMDDETDVLVLLEQCFVELCNRGAINPVRPLSTAGEQDLAALRRLYNVTPASERPVVVPIDPLAQVVADYNGALSASEMKERVAKDPAYAALFEKAVSTGRIRTLNFVGQG
jgi:hypothetical protein